MKFCFIRVTPVLLLVFCYLSSASCSKNKGFVAPPVQPDTTHPVTNPPTTQAPAFNPGNGVNLQPSYYNGGNPTLGFSLMQQSTKIKSVRIEIEPSIPISTAKSWIQAARDGGYNVIATYHKYTVLGSDDAAELTAAANWWKDNYAALSAAGSFTINLMNEWGDHNLTATAYANAYNSAITIVRQVYNGTIVIDVPGWGQETHVAAQAITGTGTTGGVKINDTNIVPSVHIYPNGWNQAQNHSPQNSDLDDLASAGRGGIVGEFGNSPAGTANWSGMVTYAKTKGWSVLGWSWNGDGGDMNMVSPAWKTNATATSYSQSSYFSVIYDLL